MKERLMCTAACRHTLSTRHSRSRWPGIVELNLGEREHVVGRSTALLANIGNGLFVRRPS